MRFDFSKQQSSSEVRRHLRRVRTRALVNVLSPVAAAAILACAGALLVFAAPPDARWIDALTWQLDARAKSVKLAGLARQSDASASLSDAGAFGSGLITATDPALSVNDVAPHQG